MRFSFRDHNRRNLLEISIAFNPHLLREFFFRRDGIWRYGYVVLGDSLLLMLFCAKQIVLPEYFPEIPCYSAVLLLSYLGSRRPLFWSLTWGFLGGIMLDAGNFQPLGGSSLIFCLLIYLAYLQGRHRVTQRQPVHLAVQQGLIAISAYVLLNLLFLAGDLSWAARLALLPRQLLLGGLLNAVFAGPLLFAILAFGDSIFAPAAGPLVGEG